MIQLPKSTQMQELNKRKNFTIDEKDKFLNIVERHISIIENADRKFKGHKNKIWDKITRQFNLTANENSEGRTSQQLRTLYLNMKRRGNRRIRASLVANATCKDENEVKLNYPEPLFEESSIASSDDFVSNGITKIKIEPESELSNSFDVAIPYAEVSYTDQQQNEMETQNVMEPLNDMEVHDEHSPQLCDFVETQINSDETSPNVEIPQFKKRPKLHKKTTLKLKNKYYLERIKLTRFLRQSKEIQHKLDIRLKKLQIFELERNLAFCI